MEEREQVFDVHFSCQRCCQPLKLDSSLNPKGKLKHFQDLYSALKPPVESEIDNADKSFIEDVHDCGKDSPLHDVNQSGKGNAGPSSSNSGDSGVQKKVIHSIRNKLDKCPEYEYSLIEESQLASPFAHGTLQSNFDESSMDKGKDLKLQIQLFDILSDQSDIDHPLCEDCANFVLKQMDYHLKILEDECADYSKYMEELELQDSTTVDEISYLDTKLNNLQSKQNSLIKELTAINRKQNDLETQLEKQNDILKRLTSEEDKFWQEYNHSKFTFFQCEEEQFTLENKLKNAKEFYEKLKKTSILNVTFHIWYNGAFGTINGFRLGRMANIQVEWHEINAAWGQCALLLNSLARKINITFERYKIVPYGNYSFIESLDNKSKQLPLYTSGGFKYYMNQKFNAAMMAFIDCLQQFNEEANKKDPVFKLPYE